VAQARVPGNAQQCSHAPTPAALPACHPASYVADEPPPPALPSHSIKDEQDLSGFDRMATVHEAEEEDDDEGRGTLDSRSDRDLADFDELSDFAGSSSNPEAGSWWGALQLLGCLAGAGGGGGGGGGGAGAGAVYGSGKCLEVWRSGAGSLSGSLPHTAWVGRAVVASPLPGLAWCGCQGGKPAMVCSMCMAASRTQ
jgi:hypothetical protein